jgi:hypothetical protein
MMKALATWSPAPYLSVTAVEREDSRWLVTVCSRERAYCPLTSALLSSIVTRHSIPAPGLPCGDVSTPMFGTVSGGAYARCSFHIWAAG